MLAAGTRVGGYEVVRPLGAGGMGAVYVARHPTLPRDVALKVLDPRFVSDAEHRGRFDREAEVLCRLDHPNIAGVRDRGQDGDVVYLVMDLVPGRDLEEVLAEQGPFAPERAVAVVEGVAAALDHAHAEGLVHRDVKPANVLLRDAGTPGERAVITDFGIVRDLVAARLTEVGIPLTYGYAAPEQFAGETPDRRTDVYALGVVLFEMLTGRRAFDATEQLPSTYATCFGPVPDPREFRPDLPPALAEVCTRAMAKDPADRYPTAGALAAAARSALVPPARAAETTRGTAPPPPPPGAPPGPPPAPGTPAEWSTPGAGDIGQPRPDRSRRPRRRSVAVVALTAALLLTAVVAWVVWPERGTPQAAGTSPSPTTAGEPDAAGGAGEPGAPAAGGASPVTPGTCLDAAGVATSCAVPHAAEVVGSGTACDAAALLGHLGGVAGEDVLRSTVAPVTRTVAGTETCVVDVPADAPAGPARDVLLGADGDAWRRCGDQLGREVSCGQPHTTEVVAEASAGETLDCRERAGDYLGRPFDQVDGDLRLLEDASRCVVEVRGANVLVSSLRRLGAGALPIEAGTGQD